MQVPVMVAEHEHVMRPYRFMDIERSFPPARTANAVFDRRELILYHCDPPGIAVGNPPDDFLAGTFQVLEGTIVLGLLGTLARLYFMWPLGPPGRKEDPIARNNALPEF